MPRRPARRDLDSRSGAPNHGDRRHAPLSRNSGRIAWGTILVILVLVGAGWLTVRGMQNRRKPEVEPTAVVGVKVCTLYTDSGCTSKGGSIGAGAAITIEENRGEVLLIRTESDRTLYAHRYCMCSAAEYERRTAADQVPDSIVTVTHHQGQHRITGRTFHIRNDSVVLGARQAVWMERSTKGTRFELDGTRIRYNPRVLYFLDGEWNLNNLAVDIPFEDLAPVTSPGTEGDSGTSPVKPEPEGRQAPSESEQARIRKERAMLVASLVARGDEALASDRPAHAIRAYQFAQMYAEDESPIAEKVEGIDYREDAESRASRDMQARVRFQVVVRAVGRDFFRGWPTDRTGRMELAELGILLDEDLVGSLLYSISTVTELAGTGTVGLFLDEPGASYSGVLQEFGEPMEMLHPPGGGVIMTYGRFRIATDARMRVIAVAFRPSYER